MKRLLLFIALSLVLHTGCSKPETDEQAQEKPEGNPLAIVDGTAIYEEDLGDGTLEDAIKNEIMYQEAIRRGYDKQREIQREIKKVIAGKFMADLFSSVGEVEVSDEDITNFYNEHENEFMILRGSEIVLNDKSTAEEVFKKAISGEDFEKLVKEYSKSTSRMRGGRISITPNYHDGLFLNKEPGAIELVYDGGDTYRVIKLTKKSKAPLNIAKKGIEMRIILETKGERMNDFVDELKKQKKIKIEVFTPDGEGK